MQVLRTLCVIALLAASRVDATSFASPGSVQEAARLRLDGTLARKEDHESLSTGDMADVELLSDLDGDGHEDAVLSVSTGGTCCLPEVFLVSGSAKHPVILPIGSDGEEVDVVEIEAQRQLQVRGQVQTRYLRFDGARLNLVRTVPELAARAVIEGEAPFYEGAQTSKILKYTDVDGSAAQLECEIDTRWGTLRCDLPLADGKAQSMHRGCERFGALDSQRNGHREFVCDNDLVIGYDGSTWVVVSGSMRGGPKP
ncbi:MAG: hypothetical protein ABI411_17895 [Tahibacter sp.]